MKTLHDIVLCVLWICFFLDFAKSVNPPISPDKTYPNVIGGDIIVTPEHSEMLRQGKNWNTFPDNKWKGGVVEMDRGNGKENVTVNAYIPFYIDAYYRSIERNVILDAVKEWNNQVGTCVYWKDIGSSSVGGNRVYITIGESKDPACGSQIGRSVKPGRQKLYISLGCLYKSPAEKQITILHEMEHAIGMDHEHTRVDRDDYIEVFHENIKGFESDMDKQKSYNYDLLGPYDYYSIMHYKVDPPGMGKPFFRVKQQGIDIDRLGMGEKNCTTFTAGDIEKIRKLYSCK